MNCVVVTDTNLQKLYAKQLEKWPVFSFPPGENSKNRHTIAFLEEALLDNGYAKDVTIIGFGGGVVTDITGFLAATFCRGVRLILIPTTLIGMIDAAIGGKNGINTRHGKNFVGTIYHPDLIWIEPKFLQTLSQEELQNGIVEMQKIFLLSSSSLFVSDYKQQISTAIELKRRIIAQDIQDRGIRRILNLGHTIGHALELVSQYSISHGMAVATGIIIECDLAHRMHILESESWQRIQSLFAKVALSVDIPQLIAAMRNDKKSSSQEPRFVMLRSLGNPEPFAGEYCTTVPQHLLEEVLYDYALCPSTN